jgi:hypothetical protein
MYKLNTKPSRHKAGFAIVRVLPLFFLLYSAYLVKSAMGINLSERYSAPQVLKIPLKAFDHPVAHRKNKFNRHNRFKDIG